MLIKRVQANSCANSCAQIQPGCEWHQMRFASRIHFAPEAADHAIGG
jgi:hypothetical protein